MVNCPKCGREMRYIDQYGRWYCDFCKEYAPAGYTGQSAAPAPAPAPAPVQAPAAKPAAPVCQKCGRPMTYIKEYDRWYCYTCKEYAPKGIPAPETPDRPAVPAASAPVQAAAPVQTQTARPQPAPVVQPAYRPAARPAAPARPAVQRVPSHSHAGNPAAGGWVMLLGFLLVLTDELIYILLSVGVITNLKPPMIGSGGLMNGLPVYGLGMFSLLGITGLLIFMIGGVMTALAAKVK